MKTLIQRNLSLADTYSVISYSYTPLIDGIGQCCENCGKLISNMVTLKNQSGNSFIVGNDCAETLTSDYRLLMEVQPAFTEGKSLRARIIKNLKNNSVKDVYIYTSTDGKKFIVLQAHDGASSMKEIFYPEVTIPYIENLLTK